MKGMIMLNSEKINQIIEDVMAALPEGVKTIPADLRQHMKAALNQALVKMDVVTREEFDVQVQVLEKTRAKIELLEERLAAMHSKEAKQDDGDSAHSWSKIQTNRPCLEGLIFVSLS